MFNFRLLLAVGTICFLTACSGGRNNGKYFQDDGPPSDWGISRLETEDAVPRIDKKQVAPNRPYTVRGQRYYPITGDKPMEQIGYGSWYGKQFHGNKTSNGERYDMYKMSAAHPTMELPSYARVTNLENGRTVIVRVNDRGPFLSKRIIDLSLAAATKLGYEKKGTARLKVERITRAQIASGAWKKAATRTLGEDNTTKKVASVPVRNFEKESEKKASVTRPKQEVAIGKVSRETETPAVERKYIQEGVYVIADGRVEEPLPEKKALASSSDFWSVQIGVFRQKENAQALADHASSNLRDTKARIVEEDSLYKVIVGKNASIEEARSQLQMIKETLGRDALVVRGK